MNIETDIRTEEARVIQARGALMAVELGSERFVVVSENAYIFAGSQTHEELLGRPAIEWLGRRVTHAMRNAESQPSLEVRRHFMGQFELAAGYCDLSVYATPSHLVIEIVPTIGEREPTAYDVLKDVHVLTDVILGGADRKAMFEKLVALLRTISGFHCVALDVDTGAAFETVTFSGRSKIAEVACPAQPQLKIVEDVNLPSVGLVGTPDADLPNLTCSLLAQPSEAALSELQNAGVAACSSVGLFRDGRLWGRLKFLHETPRVPNKRTQLALAHLCPLIGQSYTRP